ncbi:putative universal stress protein UspA [Campylobacter blaseri]|uniref:Universal stress protein n=1 Tax=Campylobacter blaseri TaxID=2042961 RepID=A0A2P8R0B4_9BACT|nr:universal stress protein [Campylobacter blaseri]PSM51943.1 universal stress protein [Campylobacter blaseri]PSM53727.1 universal stress protein [Campylobacter blaseri]QKF85718.1 putative universal stress protein UspA [Campylobacter blaseri]
MNVKKIFFPIGGGEELRERIHGALLVNKYFGSHMSILAFQLDPETVYNVRMTLRGGILMDEFIETAKEELKIEQEKNIQIAKEEAEKVGITFTENQHEPSSAFLRNDIGTRSQLVEKYSKYCDLVVAAVPPNGAITGTFEAAVIKSGKPAIVIPRKLKSFKADKILLSLTGSTSSARALTNAIPFLKEAKEVHCITAHHYLEEDIDETRGRIKNYLSMHGIDPTFEVVKTEGKIPGQALLDSAKEHNADLIVAGMAENNGFREIFLGGTSKYFLQNTTIPVLM